MGEAGLLVLAWGLGWWLQIPPLARFDFGLAPAALGIVATVPMLLGLAWILTSRWPPAYKLVTLVSERLAPLLAGRSRSQLALLAVLAGVAEEVLFRGVVQVGLARVFSEPLALVSTSVIFGLAHFASPAYALMAGLVGLYLGALFLLQGSLLVPILAHALYDFVALLALDFRHGRHQRDQ
jgi:membrane protease YdiL (CAAX protease family)